MRIWIWNKDRDSTHILRICRRPKANVMLWKWHFRNEYTYVNFSWKGIQRESNHCSSFSFIDYWIEIDISDFSAHFFLNLHSVVIHMNSLPLKSIKVQCRLNHKTVPNLIKWKTHSHDNDDYYVTMILNSFELEFLCPAIGWCLLFTVSVLTSIRRKLQAACIQTAINHV